jgi:phosphatidylglycerol:prolipoprotein diacylglycerol transferase
MRGARRAQLDPDRVSTLIFAVLFAGVVGARLFYVVDHLDVFTARPLAALAIWEGGLTLWGGFLLAVPVGIWMTKRLQLPTWRTADVLAAPVALGASFGRFGCFLNGCCYGHPTNLPWGVHFPPGSEAALEFPGQAVHPSQLYNVLAGLAVFGIVLWARPRLRGEGQAWWLMLGSYALLRGVIDWTRVYEAEAQTTLLGLHLTESQWIAAGLVLVSAVAFVRAKPSSAASA